MDWKMNSQYEKKEYQAYTSIDHVTKSKKTFFVPSIWKEKIFDQTLKANKEMMTCSVIQWTTWIC